MINHDRKRTVGDAALRLGDMQNFHCHLSWFGKTPPWQRQQRHKTDKSTKATAIQRHWHCSLSTAFVGLIQLNGELSAIERINFSASINLNELSSSGIEQKRWNITKKAAAMARF
ncbi:hypothetical protein O1V64_21265 [Rouxiella badensis]|nr:hypothetical protein O1V64_21265 [Rouxiella badensis]